ncbi:hypothetical protein [Bradyrhizobium sp. 87]|uniref:hypothetical protein n=1 Tax=Bradyrhizobium sp. 87 TaxID=2782682 RepID=UPI001FF87BD3|nr:hypothetical protein [Bradyrhizobium sp. 87]MCK1429188.1 hypothetical protein [Bradyrhizobium sp. 87]
MTGIDVHRTKEVVFWEDGWFRQTGRIDLTRAALEGFVRVLLASDEVAVEATATSMAVSRGLVPFVERAINVNSLQLKAIGQAHLKTDKIDPGMRTLPRSAHMPIFSTATVWHTWPLNSCRTTSVRRSVGSTVSLTASGRSGAVQSRDRAERHRRSAANRLITITGSTWRSPLAWAAIGDISQSTARG